MKHSPRSCLLALAVSACGKTKPPNRPLLRSAAAPLRLLLPLPLLPRLPHYAADAATC